MAMQTMDGRFPPPPPPPGAPPAAPSGGPSPGGRGADVQDQVQFSAEARAQDRSLGLMGGLQSAYQDQREIRDIIDIPNDTLRNLKITEKYSELAHDTQNLLGQSSGNNWAHFATAASKQAGQTIREEDFGPVGKGIVNLFGTYDHVSHSIADGNRKVFQEIAPQFARFNDSFRGDDHPDAAKWDQFSQGFDQNQGLLRDAFHNYYQAKFEDDPKKKQELTLLGNGEIGMQEQIRLQPQIAGAMPYGMRNLLTAAQLHLKTPDEDLSLGSDVPPLKGQEFPATLQKLENPQLQSFVNAVERNPNSLKGSAAGDWSRVDDRMNYIVALFRSRALDPSLGAAPFTPQQVEALRHNQIPAGPL